jgi:chitinase
MFVVVKCNGYPVFQESSISILLRKGAPESKLVLGLPLNGRIVKLKSVKGNVGFGSPISGPGLLGQYVQEPGLWGYNEVSFCFV